VHSKERSPSKVRFSAGQEEEPVLLDLERPIPRFLTTAVLLRGAWLLLLCATFVPAQKATPGESGFPKYDLHSEIKSKGVVDEVKLLPWGARKDITQLILKSGEDKVFVYVCPKPFQEEMGIIFTKGDEISFTGSKVKLEGSDVILARELVKGTDTLMFRDDKGNPVWDSRTGK
jgi:hypothetical protein